MNTHGIEVTELTIEELEARPVAPQTLADLFRAAIDHRKQRANLAGRIRAARLAGANLEG